MVNRPHVRGKGGGSTAWTKLHPCFISSKRDVEVPQKGIYFEVELLQELFKLDDVILNEGGTPNVAGIVTRREEETQKKAAM